MNSFLLVGGKVKEGYSHIYEEAFKINNSNIIMYIALANDNYQQGLENFKKSIADNYEILVFDKDTKTEFFKEYFKKAGIIYIAGGNSNILYERLNFYSFKELVVSSQDKLYIGVSAGAIILANAGFGDKDVYLENGVYYNFKLVKGFSIVNFLVCPHYNKDGIEIFNDVVKEYQYDSLCLEDDTAILINDDELYPLKDNSSNSIYLIDYSLNYRLIPLYERKR